MCHELWVRVGYQYLLEKIGNCELGGSHLLYLYMEIDHMMDLLKSYDNELKKKGLRLVVNLQPCDVCGYFKCVCLVRKRHTEQCQFRKAAEAKVGIPCDDHGAEVCETCDACDCGAGGSIEELGDLVGEYL